MYGQGVSVGGQDRALQDGSSMARAENLAPSAGVPPARLCPGTANFSVSLGFPELLHPFHYLSAPAVLQGIFQYRKLL